MVLRRASIFLLVLTFFGLTPEYRKHIFDQIHQIVFHGQGGYNFDDVYNMPLWLRSYTFNQIKKWYDEKNKQEDDVSEFTKKVKSGVVQVPDYSKGTKLKYNGGSTK
jgi:hypothetical protein